MKNIKFFAAVLAIAFAFCSAFTTASPTSNNKRGTNTWYEYNGVTPQTVTSREDPSSYIKISSDPLCSPSSNECGVELDQDFGNTPDFTNVSFNSNGIPNGGTDFVKNETKN